MSHDDARAQVIEEARQLHGQGAIGPFPPALPVEPYLLPAYDSHLGDPRGAVRAQARRLDVDPIRL